MARPVGWQRRRGNEWGEASMRAASADDHPSFLIVAGFVMTSNAPCTTEDRGRLTPPPLTSDQVLLARKRLLRMHFESSVGHIGGNLSSLDAMLVVFHEFLRPQDRFILSKGHSAGALYTALWSIGRLHDEDLKSFHQDDTLLAGHPPAAGIADILFATGSLGHGLSLAAGTALGLRLKGSDGRVVCLTSDGEWQEGSTWEALIFIAHHRLTNLTVLVDHNDLQGFGSTAEVASMSPLWQTPGRLRRRRAGDRRPRHGCDPCRTGGRHEPAAVRGIAHGQGQRRELSGAPDGLALPAPQRRAVSRRDRRAGGVMRIQFCDAMVARATDAKMLFLTGDLGFMALEPLQVALGPRFINAGVAEQNMVSVAAGLARQGFDVWAYSIAPFCYARPFEQIRNDVCFHELPVKLVGNGGGYGYGVMGPTHHAIEDYGVLLCLPNMSVFAAGLRRGPRGSGCARRRQPPRRLPSAGPRRKAQGLCRAGYAPWRQLTRRRGRRRHRRGASGRRLHRGIRAADCRVAAPALGGLANCRWSTTRCRTNCRTDRPCASAARGRGACPSKRLRRRARVAPGRPRHQGCRASTTFTPGPTTTSGTAPRPTFGASPAWTWTRVLSALACGLSLPRCRSCRPISARCAARSW